MAPGVGDRPFSRLANMGIMRLRPWMDLGILDLHVRHLQKIELVKDRPL